MAESEKMVRKQILMTPSIIRCLERLAAKKGTSSSEIVRRAIQSYELEDSAAMEPTELMELVSTRLKEAIASTRRARHKAEETLQQLEPRER